MTAHPHGEFWQGDAIQWLSMLPTAYADLVIAEKKAAAQIRAAAALRNRPVQDTAQVRTA
jgi:hypothetical protein